MEVPQSAMITRKGSNSKIATVAVITLRGAVIIQNVENMRIDEEISLTTAVIVIVKISLLLARIVAVATVIVVILATISMVRLEGGMALRGQTALATLELGVQTTVTATATNLTIVEVTLEIIRILLITVVLIQTARIITTTRATINNLVAQMT